MSTGIAIAKDTVREDPSLEYPYQSGWPIMSPSSSAVTCFGPKTKIVIRCGEVEIEQANRPGFHLYSRDFEATFRKILERFLEGVVAASRSPELTPQLDIEESHVFRMPIPETQWLSATVVNLGPAKPRLVLDVIPDEE
jgi:hypothetical protein